MFTRSRLLLGVVVAISACADAVVTAPDSTSAPGTFSAEPGTVALSSIVFDETFVRASGKATVVERVIDVMTIQPPAAVVIETVGSGVSSGTVTLDGVIVAKSSDFKQKSFSAYFPIMVPRQVRLSVELKGTKGEALRVRIGRAVGGGGTGGGTGGGDGGSGGGTGGGDGGSGGGSTSGVLVCANTFGAYPSLAEGIAAVPAGGIVRLCSSTTPLPVAYQEIDKPLTIRADVPGAATIELTSTSAFVIANVPTGTVRVSGINFVVAPTVTRAPTVFNVSDTFDSVVVSGNRFEMPTTTGGSTLYLGPLAPATANIVVENNTFIGGPTAVDVLGAPLTSVVVRDNTFSGQLSQAILVRSGASATVTGNTASACGLGGCLRLSGAGTVSATDNVFSTTGIGLSITTAPLALSATRNDIVAGTGISSNVDLPAGSLACNYWGGGAPVVSGLVTSPAYTPIASSPIARTSGGC